jgi:phenylacetic acid degradation operon negative regulatory protein
MLHSVIVVSNARDTSTAAIEPLNARSLALSLLLGSHPPELPARALVAFGELFGVADGTMRTALSRMVANGDVTTDDGRYRLAGSQRDRQRAQDIGRRRPAESWDGRWHSIAAAAGQRGVGERRNFRTAMANHRFGELRPDLWMRPANLAAPAAADDWIVVTGHLDGIRADRLVGRLWDLDAIATTASELSNEISTARSRLDWAATDSLPPIFTLSAAIVRFLRSEPHLPDRLSPHGWPVDTLRSEYDEVEHDFQALLRRFLTTPA